MLRAFIWLAAAVDANLPGNESSILFVSRCDSPSQPSKMDDRGLDDLTESVSHLKNESLPPNTTHTHTPGSLGKLAIVHFSCCMTRRSWRGEAGATDYHRREQP